VRRRQPPTVPGGKYDLPIMSGDVSVLALPRR
jgi:hypothetical protein